jgi:hypothetical protein
MPHRPLPLLPTVAATIVLAGCAAMQSPATPAASASATPKAGAVTYQCEGGLRFQAQLETETARLDGLPGGPDQLLRDAGGLTPQQRVYSGPRLRAEFGLGADGAGVVLQVLQPQPATLRCTRA